MLTTFRPYAPDQDLLLPLSLREWLPEDHVAYFISEVVEALDLKALYGPYAGDVRRKIARKLEEHVAFRVLAAGNFPKHRTLCEFRKRHLQDFKGLFVEVVQIARSAGLMSLGTLAVDGTKVRANASKHKTISYGRMEHEERRLGEEIAEMCGLLIDPTKPRMRVTERTCEGLSYLGSWNFARVGWRRSTRQRRDWQQSNLRQMKRHATIQTTVVGLLAAARVRKACSFASGMTGGAGDGPRASTVGRRGTIVPHRH